MKTTIVKWGFPADAWVAALLASCADIAEHDMVEVTAKNHAIVIKQADKKIQERFKGFSGTYEAETIGAGRRERNYDKQGDIIKLDFNPQSGHEQAGYHPAVVVATTPNARPSSMSRWATGRQRRE